MQTKSQKEGTESQIEEPKTHTEEKNRMFEHGEPSESSLESKKEPLLSKFVRRHHAPKQIIGDQIEGVLTRKKLKR